MPALKISTRLKALVEKIEPLASWLKQNKPDNRLIHITNKDWLLLIKTPLDQLRPAGFNISHQNGVTYGTFTLRPVIETVTKTKGE